MPADARAAILAALNDARSALDALIANDGTLADIERASALLIESFDRGGRAFSCGNGGSMSDAMHFAEELTGRFRSDRAGLPVQAISNVGHLTCVANDFSYEQLFARYLRSHGRAGDCLLAISTSGSSPNVLAAARAARELGMSVVDLAGRSGSALAPLATCAWPRRPGATPPGRRSCTSR